MVGFFSYAALLVLDRASGKRTLGRLSAFDLLITMATGAAFGRVLTARRAALAEAVTAFALLVVLQYTVARLRLRSPAFSRLITAPPTLLYYRGRILHEATRRERITDADLHRAVREHGLGSLEVAEAIVLEPDGRIAVIKSGQAGDDSIVPDASVAL